MARRFQNHPRARNRTPNRAWAGLIATGYTTIAPSTKVLLGSIILSNANIDETILRTVGVLGVMSDQQAASEDIIGAVGFIRVSDTALAAGVASVPGPVTDVADDGWFVYIPIAQSVAFQSAVGVNYDFATQYNFDSKAKRRIEEGMSIAIVAENASASFGFQVALSDRLLTMVTGT